MSGGRNVLPAPLTRFVGRDLDRRELMRLLHDRRLVTITGGGGCGKTRLAIEVAHHAGTGAREAAFVDLSAVGDPGAVPSAVVSSLGLREIAGREPMETLLTQLRTSRLLVVLDNCEHVVEECAELVSAALDACPRLGVLATSREPLGIPGEVLWTVAGLTLPLSGSTEIDGEAAELFVDRARLVRTEIGLDAADVLSVAAICRALDGNPLALELAASRVRIMSVQRIASELSDRFRLLANKRRVGPSRHATLRASMDWSYQLLSEDERTALRRLAIFSGRFDLAAAEAVCGFAPIVPTAVLELLSALVDKSLVQPEPLDGFRLLETVRAYGREHLDRSGETELTGERHVEHFAERCVELEPALWSSHLADALQTVVRDLGNFRSGLDWSLTHNKPNRGAAMMAALGNFFYAMGLQYEAGRRCDEFLASDLEPAGRAEMLYWAANFEWYRDPAMTLRHGSALAAMGRAHHNAGWVARGLSQVGSVQKHMDPGLALETLREAIDNAAEAGRPEVAVDCHVFTAMAHNALGNVDDALRAGRAAVEMAAKIDWLWGGTFARLATSEAAAERGALDEAEQDAVAVSTIGEELGDPLFRVLGELAIARVKTYRGEGTAELALGRAIVIAEQTGDHFHRALIDVQLGLLHLCRGDLTGARAVLEDVVDKLALHAPQDAARCHGVLAEIAAWSGDLPAANRHLDAIGGPGEQAPSIMRARSRVAHAQQDPSRSRRFAVEGMFKARQTGAHVVIIDFLEMLALAAGDLGDNDVAARLLGAADCQHAAIGYVSPMPQIHELRALRDRLVTDLGADLADKAISEGRAMSLKDAVVYAARGRGLRSRPSSGWGSLTPTECRVVDLVVDGASNAEIGNALFVSIATVKTHLTHVFAKLAVANRRDLRAAARDNLTRSQSSTD